MRQSYFKTLLVSEVERFFPVTANIKNSFLRKCITSVMAMAAAPFILFRAAHFTIPYVELVLTERCNLNCAGCANLMPLYKKPDHIAPDTLLASLDALLKISGRIRELTLIGGEPLLYPDLPEVIKHASTQKIDRIKIISNGTFVPRQAILLSLRNPKVLVSISEYSDHDSKELTKVLTEHSIRFEIKKFDCWNDYGDTKERGLDIKDLRKSFSRCASAKCKSIYRGILFACPRAAHLAGLSILPWHKEHMTADKVPENGVDLLNTPGKGLKKRIRKLYHAEYISACDHCNPVWNRPPIKPGIQLEGYNLLERSDL